VGQRGRKKKQKKGKKKRRKKMAGCVAGWEKQKRGKKKKRKKDGRQAWAKTLPTGNMAQSQNVTNFNNVAFSETLLFGNVALLKHY
jgi:hypothetical protein